MILFVVGIRVGSRDCPELPELTYHDGVFEGVEGKIEFEKFRNTGDPTEEQLDSAATAISTKVWLKEVEK